MKGQTGHGDGGCGVKNRPTRLLHGHGSAAIQHALDHNPFPGAWRARRHHGSPPGAAGSGASSVSKPLAAASEQTEAVDATQSAPNLSRWAITVAASAAVKAKGLITASKPLEIRARRVLPSISRTPRWSSGGGRARPWRVVTVSCQPSCASRAAKDQCAHHRLLDLAPSVS